MVDELELSLRARENRNRHAPRETAWIPAFAGMTYGTEMKPADYEIHIRPLSGEDGGAAVPSYRLFPANIFRCTLDA
jgi:hypothetical protein